MIGNFAAEPILTVFPTALQRECNSPQHRGRIHRPTRGALWFPRFPFPERLFPSEWAPALPEVVSYLQPFPDWPEIAARPGRGHPLVIKEIGAADRQVVIVG